MLSCCLGRFSFRGTDDWRRHVSQISISHTVKRPDGFTLHFGRGVWLSGHDADAAKRACAVAGLPVIDSRGVLFKLVAELAIGGPMVAVGHAPCPEPHHALFYAPLAVVPSTTKTRVRRC